MSEASFLAARAARNSHRPASAQSRKQKQDDLHDFWSTVRSYLKDWNDRLSAIAENEGEEAASLSEDEKRNLQGQFTLLAQEIQYVRRICLSSSGGAAESPLSTVDPASASESRIRYNIKPPPEGDLPLADARLLHRELTQCQATLDKTKKKLLPKGKFVFRRYREAMRKREEKMRNETVENETGNDSFEQDEISRKADVTCDLETERRTLQDLDGIDVLVDSAGGVQMHQRGDLSGGDYNEKEEIAMLPTCFSTLILRNLQDCTISLEALYKSLHMVAVNGSCVRVAQAVEGPIHVTQCHTSELHISCQQLRLHDSTDLTVRLPVAPAGIILEDCRHIVFECEDNEKLLDIKDFGWLRSGIPSPNFSVQTIYEDKNETDGKEERTLSGATDGCNNASDSKKGDDGLSPSSSLVTNDSCNALSETPPSNPTVDNDSDDDEL